MFGDLIAVAPKNREAGPDKLVINTRPMVVRGLLHFSTLSRKEGSYE